MQKNFVIEEMETINVADLYGPNSYYDPSQYARPGQDIAFYAFAEILKGIAAIVLT